jgi:hypothetical protein
MFMLRRNKQEARDAQGIDTKNLAGASIAVR